MALGAYALATLANAKVYLGIADTTWDPVLEMLIDAVSEQFNSYTDRVLLNATYTALLLDGNGKEILYLPNAPITTLTSVYENDNLLTEGSTADFIKYAAEGYLYRVDGHWAEGQQNIKITYTAGYVVVTTPTIPKDLQMAVYLQVALLWKEQKTKAWGESARTVPAGSTSQVSQATDQPLDPRVKAILDKYVRIR